jgi:hypothetical protein
VLNLGSKQADAAATVPRGHPLKSRLLSLPTQIAFYVGLQDSRFLTMNRQYNASLRRAGIGHIFHTTRVATRSRSGARRCRHGSGGR